MCFYHWYMHDVANGIIKLPAARFDKRTLFPLSRVGRPSYSTVIVWGSPLKALVVTSAEQATMTDDDAILL